MNITGSSTVDMSQLIRVKGPENEALEQKARIQEVKEEPKQNVAKTDARSGASPAMYA